MLVEEVLDNIGVEVEDAKLVGAHYPGEKLHDQDAVVEIELFVMFMEQFK